MYMYLMLRLSYTQEIPRAFLYDDPFHPVPAEFQLQLISQDSWQPEAAAEMGQRQHTCVYIDINTYIYISHVYYI